MLILDDARLIASGEVRHCFEHPADRGLCLKIVHDPGRRKDHRRELKAFTRIGRRLAGHPRPPVSRYFGPVRTDRGPADAFELIREPTTGDIAPTLHEVRRDRFQRPALADALNRWRREMRRLMIPFRDAHNRNFVCVRRAAGGFDVVLVDGVGHSDALPLVDWFPPLMRRKIDRHLRRNRLHTTGSIRIRVGCDPA